MVQKNSKDCKIMRELTDNGKRLRFFLQSSPFVRITGDLQLFNHRMQAKSILNTSCEGKYSRNQT